MPVITLLIHELTVQKDKRSLLTYPIDGLVASALEEEEDGVECQFEATGLDPSDMILKKSKPVKLFVKRKQQ